MRPVLVAGVGMIPFRRPSQSLSYHVMGETAARAALVDAGVDHALVQQAYVGYVYGDSTCGQAALYGLGTTGIPIVNVNNNCATGSSALWLARQAVATGAVDCVLALGFEQMTRGALGMAFGDRDSPLARGDATRSRLQDDDGVPFAVAYFGGAGAEYARRHGASPETFAAIAVKARRHAAHNPNAVFREPVTVEEVLASPSMYGPLTRLQLPAGVVRQRLPKMPRPVGPRLAPPAANETVHFGRLAPYRDRPCRRSATPCVSRVPRTMW